MSDEVNRQLNRRVRELQNEIISWGEKFEARIDEDDSGWLYDAVEAFIKRANRLKETGV